MTRRLIPIRSGLTTKFRYVNSQPTTKKKNVGIVWVSCETHITKPAYAISTIQPVFEEKKPPPPLPKLEPLPDSGVHYPGYVRMNKPCGEKPKGKQRKVKAI